MEVGVGVREGGRGSESKGEGGTEGERERGRERVREGERWREGEMERGRDRREREGE